MGRCGGTYGAHLSFRSELTKDVLLGLQERVMRMNAEGPLRGGQRDMGCTAEFALIENDGLRMCVPESGRRKALADYKLEGITAQYESLLTTKARLEQAH
jgi:hypothetical protein